MRMKISVICWCLVLAGAAWGQGLQGKCIINVPAFGGALGSPDPVPGALYAGASFGSGSVVQTDAGNFAAVLLQAGAEPSGGSGVASLDANSLLAVSPGGEDRLHLQVQRGLVVVTYEPGTAGALLVSVPGEWVRLERGTLAVSVTADKADLALLAGQAVRFAGAVPAAASTAEGGAALAVQPGSALAEQGAALATRVSRAGVAQASAEWLVLAVRGDLTPEPISPSSPLPNTGSVQAPPAQVTPPSVATGAVANVVSVTAFTPALNTAEALLSSGEAASVVVGARLERTRIVGTSSGIVFNVLSRPPLRLGN